MTAFWLPGRLFRPAPTQGIQDDHTRNHTDRSERPASAVFSTSDRRRSARLDAGYPSTDFEDLEKELASTGWTFFYMASAIHATAAGFNREKAIDSALQRVIAGARLQHCNCIEIDEVSAHSFLGIPYVSVSAHTRHIQKGMIFSGQ
jgi:hypothetical protein